jgi:hypothetical protein
MAGSKTLYLENAALNGVLGGPTFACPGRVYIALSTANFDPSKTGTSMNEVTGGGYTRVTVTNDGTSWTTATAGSKSNNAVFTFPAATANWGTVYSFYICDALSGGNTLYGADLTTSRTINNGDTASFAVGAITLTEN